MAKRAAHPLRPQHLALFAVTTLVVVSASLRAASRAGPRRRRPPRSPLLRSSSLAAAAGLPRSFVHEEETQTATALRLAATPSALFCGKLARSSPLAALEALVTPSTSRGDELDVARPGLLLATLAAGGYGPRRRQHPGGGDHRPGARQGHLFAVLSFPVLLPLLLLAVELTRDAFAGASRRRPAWRSSSSCFMMRRSPPPA